MYSPSRTTCRAAGCVDFVPGAARGPFSPLFDRMNRQADSSYCRGSLMAETELGPPIREDGYRFTVQTAALRPPSRKPLALSATRLCRPARSRLGGDAGGPTGHSGEVVAGFRYQMGRAEEFYNLVPCREAVGGARSAFPAVLTLDPRTARPLRRLPGGCDRPVASDRKSR